MPERSSRPGRPLASSRTCDVRVCDHGLIHLRMGAVTLRLSRSQLHQAAATLEAAARALDTRAPAGPRGERLLC